MTVTVRSERAEDLSRLQEILSAAGFSEQAWELQYPDRFYEVFVAVDGSGEVVGMLDGKRCTDYDQRIGQYIAPPQAWISTIAVAEAYRRGGVGRALLAAFARASAEVGSTYVVLKVDESDDTSDRMAFFQSCSLAPVIPDQEDDVMAGLIADVLTACEGH